MGVVFVATSVAIVVVVVIVIVALLLILVVLLAGRSGERRRILLARSLRRQSRLYHSHHLIESVFPAAGILRMPVSAPPVKENAAIALPPDLAHHALDYLLEPPIVENVPAAPANPIIPLFFGSILCVG